MSNEKSEKKSPEEKQVLNIVLPENTATKAEENDTEEKKEVVPTATATTPRTTPNTPNNPNDHNITNTIQSIAPTITRHGAQYGPEVIDARRNQGTIHSPDAGTWR